MKRINSYKAVASFVRAFFEAYARGIIDATVGGDDFKKKNDPKEIKQLMLDYYGEVNQYFFDVMFSTLVRLNYKTAEESHLQEALATVYVSHELRSIAPYEIGRAHV